MLTNSQEQAGDPVPRVLGVPSVLSVTGVRIPLAEALFRRVRSGNAFEETVARMLQTIRLGIVMPGEAMPPERELAVKFGVSRDTVREAIRSLTDAGFLLSRRGRYGGTFVSNLLPPSGYSRLDDTIPPPTEVEIEDVLGLREILEVGAARAAAGRELSEPDQAMLRAHLAETQAASAEDYRRFDSRLHLAIAEFAGTPSLVPLVADNRTAVNDLLDHIPLIGKNIEHSNRQHDKIIAAILGRNPQRAAEAMREHLAGSAALLRGFLA